MNLPELRPGDVFATENPTWIGKAVNNVQKGHSSDNESTFTHSGTIMNPIGNTFEALWKYEINDIYTKYSGVNTVIARYDEMTSDLFEEAFGELFARYYDKSYPLWRLFYHFISPTLARDINMLKKPVCSELVAQMLYLCGLRGKHYMGINVDMLVDEWKNFRGVNIIWEGII